MSRNLESITGGALFLAGTATAGFGVMSLNKDNGVINYFIYVELIAGLGVAGLGALLAYSSGSHAERQETQTPEKSRYSLSSIFGRKNEEKKT